MIRILFVDDQQQILRGLERVLKTTHHGWEVEFSKNGEEALNLLSQSPFDVIVSDMRMPKMNGVELLEIIAKRYPDVIRIILSGHSDQEMIMNSLHCSHQFIAKPCDLEILKSTIEHACKRRDLLKSGKLRRIVTRIRNLPVPPNLYYEITKEMQSPDVSLKKIGNLISQDIAMSAKILQVVNSAYFGLPQKIMDVQQATTYLGMNSLRAIILSIHIFSSFAKEENMNGFVLSEAKMHSLMVSRLARKIAHVETAEKDVLDQAQIAGMLHDMGKLIMLKLPKQYRQVRELIETTGSDSVEAEYYVMKTSHAELGAYCLGIWGFPDRVVDAVAFHHKPSKLVDGFVDYRKDCSSKGAEETNH
jgi:Predicted signal transduction protein